MKIVLTLILACLIHVFILAQTESVSWKLYHAIEGVEVYTHEIDCYSENVPAQKAIILKIVNLNKEDYRIEWDLAVWYNNEKLVKNVDDGENHYSVNIAGNESAQGSCESPFGALYIFKDFITYVSPTKLTNFALENIRITKI